MDDPRVRWNDRYADSEPPTEPTPLVEAYRDRLPGERALDVATGGGRDALALAESGFAVDAIDVSDAALEIARERAEERDLEIEFVRADVESHRFPTEAYDVISVAYYHSLNVLARLVHALAPGGTLLYQHQVQSPGGEYRYRFGPNALLRGALSLRVVSYEEPFEIGDGESRVRLVARRPPRGDLTRRLFVRPSRAGRPSPKGYRPRTYG
jgi:SAM-dependent methyltransferase